MAWTRAPGNAARLAALSLCLPVFAAVAAAQGPSGPQRIDPPEANCGQLQAQAAALNPDREGSSDMRVRAGAQLCRIDASLRERVERIRARLQALGADGLADALPPEHAAWREFRGRTCSLANLGQGDSAWPRVHAANCEIAHATRRLKSLDALDECLRRQDLKDLGDAIASRCAFGDDPQEDAGVSAAGE
ncbi:lysozyme inhibitor LprI family protein [Luteimonas aquatica]|uniref:lysozyme inhibitor LprI family protein n=1 Tax=Luteimonas aquatica TaxID=450364 RepID=UPI001F594E6D|nr:lysozyme inhibitor LprI family protein [Luteimonas aquatica]